MGAVAPIKCATWRFAIRQAPRIGSPVDPLPEIIGGEFIDASWIVDAKLAHDLSSPARVVLTLRSCGALFGSEGIVVRRDELLAWRGDEDEPTFVGPCVTVIDGEQATIVAYDRAWWMVNRSRTQATQGDVSNTLRSLYAQAEAQGVIGLGVDTRLHGRSHVCEQITIGADLEEAQARWSVRGTLLQGGPQPFWRSLRVWTEADWEELPALGVLGEYFHTDVVGSSSEFHASTAGIWGRTTEVLSDATDSRARWVLTSTPYSGAGTSDGRGPRIEVISGSTDVEGGAISVSLRQGLDIEWDSVRPGAWVRAAIAGRHGLSVGTLDAPRDMEVTRLEVAIGAGGREEGVSVDLATVTDTTDGKTTGVG